MFATNLQGFIGYIIDQMKPEVKEEMTFKILEQLYKMECGENPAPIEELLEEVRLNQPDKSLFMTHVTPEQEKNEEVVGFILCLK